MRRADGRTAGTKAMMVAGGRWSGTVRYTVGHRQRGTLEAVDLSARDGSLAALAQVPVTLVP